MNDLNIYTDNTCFFLLSQKNQQKLTIFFIKHLSSTWDWFVDNNGSVYIRKDKTKATFSIQKQGNKEKQKICKSIEIKQHDLLE